MLKPKLSIGDKIIYGKNNGFLTAVIVSAVLNKDIDEWEYSVSIDSNNIVVGMNTKSSTVDGDGFARDYVLEHKIELVYSNLKENWIAIKN